MPYSPNVTLVPPLAAPCRSGRCCLRCLALRAALVATIRAAGTVGPVGRTRTAAALLLLGRRPVPVPALPGPQCGRGRLTLGPGLRGLAAVDPYLHADPAE